MVKEHVCMPMSLTGIDLSHPSDCHLTLQSSTPILPKIEYMQTLQTHRVHCKGYLNASTPTPFMHAQLQGTKVIAMHTHLQYMPS